MNMSLVKKFAIFFGFLIVALFILNRTPVGGYVKGITG